MATKHPAPEKDNDSIYEGSIVTDTTTLNSTVLNYRKENGRTYHAYGSTQYWGPNDEAAQMNQDLSHHLFTLILGGKLVYAPIDKDKIKHVLDLGCGTGMWAIDFADAYENASVKGIDLSPIQPSMIPPNCVFEVDDYNQDFVDIKKYDLIHQRELLGTCPDWEVLYKNVFRALKPGGWLDILELDGTDPTYFSAANDDLPLPRGNAMRDSNEYGNKAVKMMGLTLDDAPKIEERLKKIGFVNIKVEIKNIPIGPWMEDKDWKEIGRWNFVKLQKGIEDYMMRPLTMMLGWTTEDANIFLRKYETVLNDISQKLYYHIYLVAAQRPEE